MTTVALIFGFIAWILQGLPDGFGGLICYLAIAGLIGHFTTHSID